MPKHIIRTEKLKQREALTGEVHADWSRRICEHLQQFIANGNYSCVALYMPIRNEPDVRPLLDAKYKIALPVMGEGKLLRFRQWRKDVPLVTNAHGIAEPSAELPELSPDVIVVPCAAFDRTGHRIGYRGGYYDATLAHVRAQKTFAAVGVAFAFQEVPAIPAEPHDMQLDAIITESGYLPIT